MPSYGKPITLNHLLHHTSGIREYTSLMLMGGHDVNFEDRYTNNDAYYTAWHQKELNFQPGDKYRYSSGGYILLAKVIEKVTGKSLRQFADSVLFKPLGMSHTFFHDQHGAIIANRVESYYPLETGYRQYIKTFDMVGDGGLITTLGDLAKWDAAFYQDRLGISGFAQKMGQRFTLTNGRMIPYAWGLNNDTYQGLPTLEHGGFMLGYDSDILRFPDQQFTVIVLNNARGRIWSTRLAYQIADIYLADFFKKRPESLPIRSTRQSITQSNAQQRTGAYWNVDENYFIQIDRSGDTLIYNDTNGWTPRLIPLRNDTFQLTGTGFQLVFPAKGQLHFIDPDAPYPVQEFERFDPQPPTSLAELKSYAGEYYSEELETTYHLSIDEKKLALQINKNTPIQLYPPIGRIVWNGRRMVWIGTEEIKFEWNAQGHLIGLATGDQRVKGVHFRKIK